MSQTRAQVEVRVCTGSYQTPGRAERWCYSVEAPGRWPFRSPFRYGSEQAARLAGLADGVRLALTLSLSGAQQ